jgi:hypothetical protein
MISGEQDCDCVRPCSDAFSYYSDGTQIHNVVDGDVLQRTLIGLGRTIMSKEPFESFELEPLGDTGVRRTMHTKKWPKSLSSVR